MKEDRVRVSDLPSVSSRPRSVPQLSLGGLPVVGCFAALYLTAVRPVTDTDVWWHLATGRYILATGTIPHHDIFSSTARGNVWITHEWLTEVVLYWLQSHMGYGALMLLWGAVITLSFAVVYLLARAAGAARWIALPVTLLAAAACSHTWGVRPQMLSLLFFAIYVAVLSWPGRLSRGRLVALVALLPLWVNLHGGYIFGLLLIGLEAAAAGVPALLAARERRAERLERAGRLVAVLAACVVAALVNPNTWRALTYPFSYLGNNASVRYVAEWVSPNFHETRYLFFEALLFLLLVALAVSPRRPSFREILIPLVFAYLGLQSVRNISLFCVVAVPIAAAALQQIWVARRAHPAAGRAARPASPVRGLINWVIALCIAVVTLLSALPLGTAAAVRHAQDAAFPARAVAYLQSHRVPQPLFNSYNWGGYLIWTLYPRYRVYIDGRPDMYGDAYVDNFITIYTAGPHWQAGLDRAHIASVLVEPDSELAKLLALSPGWQRRYSDKQAVLYVRAAVHG